MHVLIVGCVHGVGEVHQLTQWHFTHHPYELYTDTDEGLEATSRKPISQLIHCSYLMTTEMLLHAYILYEFPEYVIQIACNALQCVTRYKKQLKKCIYSINSAVHLLCFTYLKKLRHLNKNV